MTEMKRMRKMTMTADEKRLCIQFINADGKQELVLHQNGKMQSLGLGYDPCWAADGKTLLFLKPCGDEKQLMSLNAETEQIRQMTSMRYGVEKFTLSPDATMVALECLVPKNETGEPLTHEKSKSEKNAEAYDRVTHPYVTFEDFGYKSDAAFGFCKFMLHTLWIMNLTEGAEPRRISETGEECTQASFSKDGKKIVYVKQKQAADELTVLNVADGSTTCFAMESHSSAASYEAPLWLADDQTVVFVLHHKLYMKKDGENATPLMPENEVYVSDFTWGSALATEGEDVLCIAKHAGKQCVYRVSAERKTAEKLASPCGDVMALEAHGDKLVMFCRNAFDETSLYTLDEATGNCTRLMGVDDPNAIEVSAATLDGQTTVFGTVIPPINCREGEKYPAVVLLPDRFAGYDDAVPGADVKALTEAGVGVCVPKYRSSFAPLTTEDYQRHEDDAAIMTDVLQWMHEAMDACPWVDAERLGAVGFGWGGALVVRLCAETKRFHAAATQNAVAADLIQFASAQDTGTCASYDSFTDFMMDSLKTSPVSMAEKVNVPFLVQHAMQDMVCPVEHAHQLYSALKETHPDIPIRLMLMPHANHVFLTEGTAEQQKVAAQAVADWMKNHL
jgi:dipeptidyl aminopeptidase/acylaminoacyl peptidase